MINPYRLITTSALALAMAYTSAHAADRPQQGGPLDLAIANEDKLIEMLRRSGRIDSDASIPEAEAALRSYLKERAAQAVEYAHAYHELNLTLESGIYGSTFFMLTGFHGFHVTMGATMLVIIALRSMKGHFTNEKHFAFEAVAWYWHFVDVVWLGLFIFVYWLV